MFQSVSGHNSEKSIACEQAPSEGEKKHSAIESVIPSAKRVRSRIVTLTLDYTRLARSKTNREPVRRLEKYSSPQLAANCIAAIRCLGYHVKLI